MSDSSNTISVPAVPSPNPPTGSPAAVSPARELLAEKQAEAERDKAEAEKKKTRFTVKRVTSLARPVAAGPEYETLIFKSAANNPLANLTYPQASTFVPSAAPLFFILNYMDFLMASTKRWVDNCMGWAPPISQMYISILFYIQILRTMDASGILPFELVNVLNAFSNLFPLAELWIPGPLVSCFRAISAFRADADDLFGPVSPALPARPGWSRARTYVCAHNLSAYIPNISVFVSRLRYVCDAAINNANDTLFANDVNGPAASGNLFTGALTAACLPIFRAPGTSFVYPGNRDLWVNARSRLVFNRIPRDLNFAVDNVNDRWSAFFRFDDLEHQWFGPVSAIMAKYCQFFRGSTSLADCSPCSSAASAVKCVNRPGTTTLFDLPNLVRAAGAGNNAQIGNAAAQLHFALNTDARLAFDATCTIRDLPDANAYAGMTWCLNGYINNADRMALIRGGFWNVSPDVLGRDNVELLPGVLSTIVREYHSDTRIDASKQ